MFTDLKPSELPDDTAFPRTPQSGRHRSYADGFGISVEEFLASKRRKEAPASRPVYVPAFTSGALRASYLHGDNS